MSTLAPPLAPRDRPAADREGRRWFTGRELLVVMTLGLVMAFSLSSVACSSGDGTDVLVDAAVAASADQRWEDSEAAWTQVIAQEPDPQVLAQAYVERSWAVTNLGRFDDAIEDATAAIDLDPEPETLAHAYVNRANALGELARFEDAIEDIAAAIDLDPGPELVGWANLTLMVHGLELDADVDALAQAYVNRAFALLDRGRAADAIDPATAAIELGPSPEILAQAYAGRSGALVNMDRFDDAIEDATAAIDLNPEPETTAGAYLMRAKALDELGRFDDAIDDLELALETLPPGDDFVALIQEALEEINGREADD